MVIPFGRRPREEPDKNPWQHHKRAPIWVCGCHACCFLFCVEFGWISSVLQVCISPSVWGFRTSGYLCSFTSVRGLRPYFRSASLFCGFTSVRGSRPYFRSASLFCGFTSVRGSRPYFRSASLFCGFTSVRGSRPYFRSAYLLCVASLRYGDQGRTSDLRLSSIASLRYGDQGRTSDLHISSVALRVSCSLTGAFPRFSYSPANRPVPQEGTKRSVRTRNKAVGLAWALASKSDALAYDFW